ncbi:4-alpha-glucanotransferase [Deinococcus peraridilitoris]|uniref:4-alpha-glucanotransferase n=1 Tax=Deinococcus peraridilitoris (strain DSM 19664 / LMG 22246 / CIP 109416 / KR-200) TaxID=937777 RepID=L0A516_DEIPD|nr:4-alpha-glucanotransferase [Deinococcus peraridilitoris]AFZ68978.1 4-alpha-glucanotransferase [Deinococcus peraridilitoris DSM 19664]
MTRSSGVLLHLTSLPGPYGIGEFNEHAYACVDWLARAGQQYWQVMPLGPTGYGDSPYQSFSAFAGNPYLISLDALRRDGLLSDQDLSGHPDFDHDRVDFGVQYTWRNGVLRRAFEHFEAGAGAGLTGDFQAFCEAEAAWLDDYALFMALKDAHGGRAWNEWDREIRTRQSAAMAAWRDKLEREVRLYSFVQFLFFRQWNALRAYAHQQGVQIIGDIPIFVAMDSADAWANPDQFYFDAEGQPSVVAGVPPDYFSATGQLWGNPLYRWDVMQQQGFRWWIERIQGSLKLYDVIRIDHFRGFAAYWEIPYPAENAMNGQWVPAPGHALFEAVRGALGELPIIAEDLGVVTPDVEALRDDFGLPGMAVLQFAFGGNDWEKNAFLPENLRLNQVVYPGTHDNDTSLGWWHKAQEHERRHVMQYLPDASDLNFGWRLTELAWSTRCVLAVAQLQDLLNLGSEARINLPGSLGAHNWTWRARPEAFSSELARDLRALTERHDRLPR